MQSCGLLLIIPLLVGLYYSEMAAIIIGKVEILIVLVTIYLGKSIIGGAVKAAASRLRGFVKGKIIG